MPRRPCLWTQEDIFDINVDGTKNVLEAEKNNSGKRVIHASSTAVSNGKMQAMLGWFSEDINKYALISSRDCYLEHRK